MANRQLHRLSARTVQTVRQPGRYGDGNNLFLSISPNGGKRWVLLFRWSGRLVEMGLGSARDVTLAEARGKAVEGRKLLSQGINPLEAQQAAQAAARPPKAISFGEVADAFVESMASSRKNARHHDAWKLALGARPPKRGTGVYAGPLRPLPVAAVSTEHVLKVLRPMWQERPEQASRLRGRIETVLDAAKAAGHRDGDNPARWKGHLERLLAPPQRLSRGHHAALDYTDVPQLVRELRACHGTSARCMEWLVLTAVRTTEARAARWDEIDFANAVWVVPASRAKMAREHRVPLVARAVELLEEMRAVSTGAFIFPGNKPEQPLSPTAMIRLLRRLRPGLTVHGFRSSFRTFIFECTSFPEELAEACLAHVAGKVERAYQRGDGLARRHEIMRAWSNFIEGDRSGVVQLRAVGAGA
jgi:integrase